MDEYLIFEPDDSDPEFVREAAYAAWSNATHSINYDPTQSRPDDAL